MRCPTSVAIRRTPSKSPWDETGKPASKTSTPRREICFAIATFSSIVKATPGDYPYITVSSLHVNGVDLIVVEVHWGITFCYRTCSPSRSVVSRTINLLLIVSVWVMLKGEREGKEERCLEECEVWGFKGVERQTKLRSCRRWKSAWRAEWQTFSVCRTIYPPYQSSRPQQKSSETKIEQRYLQCDLSYCFFS